MMDATVSFDERHPGACVGFKRAKLGKIERVPNLTRHWLTVGHGFPPYAFKSGIGNEKAHSRSLGVGRPIGTFRLAQTNVCATIYEQLQTQAI
jgi:hypothetical protein